MVLVCYNLFGLFVRHPSWSVEGGTKVSEHPVHTLALIISHNYHSICAILHKSLTMSRIRVMCIHEEKYVNHRGSEYCHEML